MQNYIGGNISLQEMQDILNFTDIKFLERKHLDITHRHKFSFNILIKDLN